MAKLNSNGDKSSPFYRPFWVGNIPYSFDVRGSVRHSIIHIKNPTRCNSVSKFYFIFIWSSTCFGRHTAHHQEPKTALAASGFSYVEGCWWCSCWTLTASSNYTTNNFPHMKTRGCYCSFRLLMMGGVSPETCWASYKYEIKFLCTVASCWIFYVNYTMMHGTMYIKFTA